MKVAKRQRDVYFKGVKIVDPRENNRWRFGGRYRDCLSGGKKNKKGLL